MYLPFVAWLNASAVQWLAGHRMLGAHGVVLCTWRASSAVVPCGAPAPPSRPQQMDLLVQTLDPAGQGRVSFDAFSAGIKNFLFGELHFLHTSLLVLPLTLLPLNPPTQTLSPAKALQKDDSVDSTTLEPLLVGVSCGCSLTGGITSSATVSCRTCH